MEIRPVILQGMPGKQVEHMTLEYPIWNPSEGK